MVTEELGSPAVIFDMSLSPVTRQSFEDSGSKLRAAIATIFVTPAQGGRTALNDQVFVTASREVRWASFILYNATHPMNTEGNSLIDVEALMTEMGASTLATAARSRVLRTVAAATQHQSHHRPRQLFGTLELITNNQTLPIDLKSTVVIVTFNIIMRNSLDASALMTALKNFAAQQTTTRRMLLNSADVLAEAIVPPSGSGDNTTTLVTIDSASVRSIILIFSKSYWGIFLDWLLRNAYNVIMFCGCLSIIFLILFAVRIFLAKRTLRLTAKIAVLRAEQFAIHAAIVKARGDKIRKERWIYIRRQFIRVLLPAHAFILAGRRWKASGGSRVHVKSKVNGSPFKRVLPHPLNNNSDLQERRGVVSRSKPILSPPSMPIKQMPAPSPLPVHTLVPTLVPTPLPADGDGATLISFATSSSRSHLQAAALRDALTTVSESNNNDIPFKKPELRLHIHDLALRMRAIETKAQTTV